MPFSPVLALAGGRTCGPSLGHSGCPYFIFTKLWRKDSWTPGETVPWVGQVLERSPWETSLRSMCEDYQPTKPLLTCWSSLRQHVIPCRVGNS
ncbi:Prolyl 3-Hydroxylase 1 [Manis pentadactyla]|nr:Prolyl 3-Hydroxylase 1 [Manis pentadactyla]